MQETVKLCIRFFIWWGVSDRQEVIFLIFYTQLLYLIFDKCIFNNNGCDNMKTCPNCGHEMLNDNFAECPKCGFNLYSHEKKNNRILSNINKKLPKAVGDIGEQITTQVKKEESYIKTRLDDDSTVLVDENEFFISKTVFDGIDYITNKKQELKKGKVSDSPKMDAKEVIIDDGKVTDETSAKEPVDNFQEKSSNASNKSKQNNKKTNKKKKRKGIISKLAEKNDEMVAEQNREIREKVQPLLPEYAKILNTSSDNLYVASVRVYSYVKGTKSSYTQFGRQIFIMTLNNDNIAYIPFADIVRDNIRYFESRDMLSISFKNISSISNKRIGYIELEMNGDNSFAIETKDLFGKQINNGFLEKYNNFIASSTITENNSSSESTSNADELLKYAELYKQGLLSEEEFEAKKKELLSI